MNRILFFCWGQYFPSLRTDFCFLFRSAKLIRLLKRILRTQYKKTWKMICYHSFLVNNLLLKCLIFHENEELNIQLYIINQLFSFINVAKLKKPNKPKKKNHMIYLYLLTSRALQNKIYNVHNKFVSLIFFSFLNTFCYNYYC